MKTCQVCGTELKSNRAKYCTWCKSIIKLSDKSKARKLLERLDCIVGDVETIIPGTYLKRDLWNMFDLIAVPLTENTKFIQVFSAKLSGDKFSTHLNKMMDANKVLMERLLIRNNTIELWGFKDNWKKESRAGFIVWQFRTLPELWDNKPFKFRLYFDGATENLGGS